MPLSKLCMYMSAQTQCLVYSWSIHVSVISLATVYICCHAHVCFPERFPAHIRTEVYALAHLCEYCSTEKMFEDLDEDTKNQILPLKTVNRKASEFQGFHMNWEGTRRLDDFEERWVAAYLLLCSVLIGCWSMHA